MRRPVKASQRRRLRLMRGTPLLECEIRATAIGHRNVERHWRIWIFMTSQLVTPVILCGGAGTRLWPVSREKMPKHFVPLIGTKTTFQQVVDRVNHNGLFAPPMIITNSDFRFVVAEQTRACGVKATIILEPQRRDSAAAIAAAAQFAVKSDPDAILLVVAADHLIPDVEAFAAACRAALPAAAAGSIVTFGVKPTYPASSYGYIRPKPAADGAAVRQVEAFVEKPEEATATRYIKDGYLWNSGNFMFRADVMMRELSRFEPAIASAAKDAVDNLVSDLDFFRLAEGPFSQAPRKSIDYAVMERTEHAAVLPVDFRWSDVGNWNSVWEVQQHDPAGNVIEGRAELLDTSDSLIRSDESMLTTVVGLNDIVVVATPDAVLVVAKRDAERVKDLVEQMKTNKRAEALEHRRVYRPWGFYQGADAGARYQVKRISVNPGARLSLQKHFHRSEHWVVVRGVAEVTVGDDVRLVHENESVYVPIGAIHRLANPGKILLELIEVQVGSYLGEDDILRLDDVYHRHAEA
jgi:mannose-1-phosphate guanylyltransferase / mannose-6-phosphate isomerase